MKFIDVEFSGIPLGGSPDVDNLRSFVGIRLLNELRVESVSDHFEELGGFNVEGRLTVHTRLAPALGCFATPRTNLRCERFRLFLFNVDTMGFGDFPVAGVCEDGNVPGSDTATPRPSVVLFEDGLIHTSGSEVTGRRLSEVRQRDGLVNASILGTVFEDFPVHVVGELFRTMELAPEGRIRIVGRRVVLKPPLEVRDARDERDRTLASLSVDGNHQPTVMVCHIANVETPELSGSGTRVPRDGYHGRPTRVAGGVKHRADIFFPVEHVAGVGRRLIVTGGSRRDPLNGVGNIIAIGGVEGEHTERDAVVLVRLLVVVLPVNPADDFLGRIAVVSGVGQVADFLAHADTTTEEMFVAMVAIPRGEQEQSIGEIHESVLIGGGEFLSLVDSFAEALDSLVRVHSHANKGMTRCNVNPQFKSRTEHYPISSDTASTASSGSLRPDLNGQIGGVPA